MPTGLPQSVTYIAECMRDRSLRAVVSQLQQEGIAVDVSGMTGRLEGEAIITVTVTPKQRKRVIELLWEHNGGKYAAETDFYAIM